MKKKLRRAHLCVNCFGLFGKLYFFFLPWPSALSTTFIPWSPSMFPDADLGRFRPRGEVRPFSTVEEPVVEFGLVLDSKATESVIFQQ